MSDLVAMVDRARAEVEAVQALDDVGDDIDRRLDNLRRLLREVRAEVVRLEAADSRPEWLPQTQLGMPDRVPSNERPR